jgi:ABC-2 type transport system permease protein
MKASRVVGAAAFMALSYMKEPLAFVSDLIIPLVMFMVVQLGTGKGVESLLGILVAISWSSGSFALARKLATYSVWRLLDMFVASPLKPIEFAVASALAHLTIIVAPAVVVVAIMALTVGVNPMALPFIAASMLLAWFAGTAFGLYAYGKLADPLRVSSAANLLNLLLILLPPVIYPVSILPRELQLASALVPTVALKLVAQHLAGVPAEVPPLLSAAAAAAYTALFTALALRQRLTVE